MQPSKPDFLAVLPTDEAVTKAKFADTENFQGLSNLINFTRISHSIIDESTHSYIQKNSYLSRIGKLAHWILFIHTATLMCFVPHLTPEEEKYSNNALIDWLFSKTAPPCCIIPVKERIPQSNDHMNKSLLEEGRMITIQCLSREIVEERYISNSCKLLLIWYRKSHSQISEHLKGFDEANLIFLVENVISQAKRLKRKFQKKLESLGPLMKFGCFHPSCQMKLSTHMNPEKYSETLEGFDVKNMLLVEKKTNNSTQEM
jgi:hypothetical protein